MKVKSLNWVEIDLKTLKNNIKLMSAVLQERAEFMLMVKGNAYGHGLIEISRVASEMGASYLGVSALAEAVSIRKNNIKTPVLLLTEVEQTFLPAIIRYKITPTVYSLGYAEALSKFAQKKNKVLPVHIKIDTGLNRFGFKIDQALQDVIKISQLNNLKIEGIFTHFADAIDNLKSARKQLNLFKAFCNQIEEYKIFPKYKHAANSPALVWLQDSHLDLVRFGLAAYGLEPSVTKKYPLPIQPVLAWKTKVLQLKFVKKGENIGYGKAFRATKDLTIAVIGVGYADGFRRSPKNYKQVLIQGKKCPIVGNVTMNFTMIDVTKISAKVYDEVVLIGRQKSSSITLEELAILSRTINEEIVTVISALVPRKYLN